METSSGSPRPPDTQLPPRHPSSKARQGRDRTANLVAQKASLSPWVPPKLRKCPQRGPWKSLQDTPHPGASAANRTGQGLESTGPIHILAPLITDHERLFLSPHPSSLRVFTRGDDAQLLVLPAAFQTITSMGCAGEHVLVTQGPCLLLIYRVPEDTNLSPAGRHLGLLTCNPQWVGRDPEPIAQRSRVTDLSRGARAFEKGPARAGKRGHWES